MEYNISQFVPHILLALQPYQNWTDYGPAPVLCVTDHAELSGGQWEIMLHM